MQTAGSLFDCRTETRAEKRDRRRLRDVANRRLNAARTDSEKAELLAKKILEGVRRDRCVLDLDLAQSGLPLAEAKRLKDDAFAIAWAADPALMGAVQ